ncbi:hypothetical protein T492DRAFT_989086 [Pavlovales sp. CCMP2436]|nr:hypothetical protein T492DRAFT_989086 [Pavlovales sp. CCMP2436]
MRLRVLRSAWGLRLVNADGRFLEPARVLDGVCASGLDGLEASLADLGARRDGERGDAWMRAAAERSLSLVVSAYSSWPNYSDDCYDSAKPAHAHEADLLLQLRVIAELHARAPVSPLLGVNCHTGTDVWSEAEGARFFAAIAGPVATLQLPRLTHETHRGRFLCCPFATARLLDAVPSVRLTSDLSHWVIKTERLLDAREEAELLRTHIAPACDHIHARVGTAQAPQLVDDDAPSAAVASERLHGWWQTIWDAREAASFSARDTIFTATVEHGPFELDARGQSVGYWPALPSGKPVPGPPLDVKIERAARRLRNVFDRWHSHPYRGKSSCQSPASSQPAV